ncbi:MAG: hypothetical protein WC421_00290 [Elusimicrobiales bacterium]
MTHAADTLVRMAEDMERAVSNLGLKNYHCENLELLWTGELETDEDGAAYPNPPAILEWDRSRDGYRGFLKMAKSLGAPVIYTKARRFLWQEELFGFLDLPDVSPGEELRIKAAARRFTAYDGYVGCVMLAFKLGDVWHSYQEMAPWYRRFLDAMDGCLPENCAG